ncbi:MAG TPA: plastocyanin/azurin family copper-binding protein [Thermoanaerobaculia bacterium]|jgi:plastocyanin
MKRVVIALACAAVISACTPDEAKAPDPKNIEPASQTAGTTTSPLNPPVPAEKDQPVNRAGGAADPSAEVQLIEYAIRMPQTIAAGRQKFSVENAGREQHAFEIEGNGIHTATQVLSRGNSTSLEVDLKPGTYTVYCPVKGHKEKGMATTVTVQ